jgi:hypothetical protein
MKVKELIELLEKIENKEKEVRVAISVYSQSGPVAYCTPWDSDYLRQNDYDAQINVTLPEKMHTVTRK